MRKTLPKITESSVELHEVINDNYVSYSWIKSTLGLTSAKIKNWREGMGIARKNPLRFYRFDDRTYFYNKTDLLRLYSIWTIGAFKTTSSKIEENNNLIK